MRLPIIWEKEEEFIGCIFIPKRFNRKKVLFVKIHSDKIKYLIPILIY